MALFSASSEISHAGLTRTRSLTPKFLALLAVAPILPCTLGSTSITKNLGIDHPPEIITISY